MVDRWMSIWVIGFRDGGYLPARPVGADGNLPITPPPVVTVGELPLLCHPPPNFQHDDARRAVGNRDASRSGKQFPYPSIQY